VAVVPDLQKQGIGKKLICEGIRKAQAMNFRSILVLGDTADYGKFGFRHELASKVRCKYQCQHFQGLELRPEALANLGSPSTWTHFLPLIDRSTDGYSISQA
jgi:putative acetyltransferase